MKTKNLIKIASLFILVFHGQLIAQLPIEVIPIITQPYPTELGDLNEDFTNYMVTVINHTEKDQNLYFLAELRGVDNGVRIYMDPIYRPSDGYAIEANETVTLTTDDLEEINSNLQEEFLVLEGITRPQLALGTIPEGFYQLCINAYDYDSGQQMSVGCGITFPVGNSNTPTITFPPREDYVLPYMISPTMNITWEFPVSDPMLAMDLEYVLKIIDLTEHDQWGDIEQLFSDAAVPVVIEETVDGTGMIMNTYLFNDEGDEDLLDSTHMYGVRVQVIDPSGSIPFDNGHYSEIHTFHYGADPRVEGTNDEDSSDTGGQDGYTLPEDCESRCTPVAVTDSTAVTDLAGISDVRIGHFFLTDRDFSHDGDGWSGEAEIELTFLNLKITVDAVDLQINAAGEVFGGFVRGHQDDITGIDILQDHLTFEQLGLLGNIGLDVGIGVAHNNLLDSAQQAMLTDLMTEVRNVRALAGGPAVGLPFGFDQELQGSAATIGITDLLLTPSGAKARISAGAKLSIFEGENWLMMAADSVCIHPAGFGGEYIISLDQDLVFQNEGVNENENALEIRLNGSSSNPDRFCGIEMTCNGIEAITVSGNMNFPKNMLTQLDTIDGLVNPTKDEKVTAKFDLDIVRGAPTDTDVEEDTPPPAEYLNWIASVEMDPFYIAGLSGWEFNISRAYIDMSDLSNPEDVVFPEEYDITTPDFRGFYIEEATLIPPKHVLTDSTSATVRDLVVGPTLYCDIEVENILPLEKGQIAGFGFSMDTVKINYVDGELMDGWMHGRMQMPMFAEGESMKYTAFMSNVDFDMDDDPSMMYAFQVDVDEDLHYPFFIAEGTIYTNSVLDVTFIPEASESASVHTMIYGNISVDTEAYYPDALPDIPADILLLEMDYQFDYDSELGFNNDNTMVSFASPQKKVGGFLVGMDDFDVGLAAEGNQVSVNFGVQVGLAKGNFDLHARAEFDLISNMSSADLTETDASISGAWNTAKKLRLDRVDFDRIALSIEKPTWSISGEINWYNEPIGSSTTARDKGIQGDVSVVIPIEGLTGQLFAKFGNIGTPPEVPPGTPIDYNEEFYSYWYVDGLIASELGIPIMSGVGVYGIGGGIAYNIVQTSSQSIENGVVVGEPTYTPEFGGFGIKFLAIIGTHPEPDGFNADIGIQAQFNAGGLDMVGFVGDGYLATSIADRPEAKFQLGLELNYYTNRPTRPWFLDGYMHVGMNVDNKLVGTMPESISQIDNQFISANFFVNNSKWLFHAGAPYYYSGVDPRGSAEVNLGDNGMIDLKMYMMVGHDVPTELPPMHPDVVRILNDPGGELEDTESADDIDNQLNDVDHTKGTGIATGAAAHLISGFNAWIIYGNFEVWLGFDMNLTKPDKRIFCANTGEYKGANGWYASGQAYAGLEGNVGIRFKLMGKEQNINLFELAAAIALQGGAPKPAYFGAMASVHFSCLGGKLRGSSTFALSVGERCAEVPGNPLANIKFFEVVDPKQNQRKVLPQARVYTKFALPMDKAIVLNVPQEDANGDVVGMQTVRYTPKLTTYKIEKDFGNQARINLKPINWLGDDEHDQVVLRPTQNLQTQKWYKATMKIKAWDHQTGNWLVVDGREWSQDTIVRFKTDDWPDDLYEFVAYSRPLPYQRYFLQYNGGANGYINFTGNLPQDVYFPSTTAVSTSSQFDRIVSNSYFIRLTNLHTQEEEEIPIINYTEGLNGTPRVKYVIPELANESIYALQLIRRSSGSTNNTNNNTLNVIDLVSGYNGDESAELQLVNNVIAPGQLLGENEFLLYHTYFRTSEFNRLSEKVEAMSVDEVELIGDSNTYGAYARVRWDTEENFEQRDFRDFYPLITYNEDYRFKAKVILMDYFDESFHDNKSKPKIGGFHDTYEDMYGSYPYTRAWPYSDLNFGWQYGLPRHRINNYETSHLDPPLSEAEITGLWSNYLDNGNLGYGAYIVGGSITGPHPFRRLYTRIKTNRLVTIDKKHLQDWAVNYMATFCSPCYGYFYQTHMQLHDPQFIDKYVEMANTNTKLQNNSGVYSIDFTPNIAIQPNQESLDWFGDKRKTFSTRFLSSNTTIPPLIY